MSQSQPLRIENPELWSFGTAKTQNAKLWFVNNRGLEEQALAYLAKYQEKYDVELYAKVFQGNHFHLVSRFPSCNRAQFYRDYNARLAEGVRRHVSNFEGGSLFQRRYSEQALPSAEDLEDYFFYCALQPVLAGLCERIGDYPGYNSFDDAVSGRIRTFKLVDWAAFNEARRNNKNPKKRDYTKTYSLRYTRLPGYEHYSQRDYKKLMYQKLESRRMEVVAQKKASGHNFLTKDQLRKTPPGSCPRNTKKSHRTSKRPLVLTKCAERKKQFLDWYFAIYNIYKESVMKYLKGNLLEDFPAGTYRPPGPFVPLTTI